MRRARSVLVVLAVALAGALGAPAGALAHAALVDAAPSASRVAFHAPAEVALTFTESVEPRFAVVSVTDADGRQLAEGSPRRSAADPRVVVRALRRLPRGWYLVYWRVISADGHPVRGAYTFAVGPGPGVPPQFAIPSLRETAATVPLVAARWLLLLAVMGAVGLFAFRVLVARPLSVGPARGRDPVRAVTVAWGVTLGAALVLAPVYLVLSTAKFAALSA